MRLNYYRFPAESDPMERFNEGCAVILKTGNEIYPESIPDDKWPLAVLLFYTAMKVYTIQGILP